jgi:hypothetical protein
MDITTFLIVVVIQAIIISISFTITDFKYRICYYMVVALLSLSVLNIYLSVVYYIQLRNDVGIPGQQGDKGPTGVRGPGGKCSFSAKCGITDPRQKILDVANKMYDIKKECLDKPTLSTCGNQDTLDQAMPINTQINMLEKIAYSTTMAESDFMEKLQVCLQDPNGCSDPTDF